MPEIIGIRFVTSCLLLTSAFKISAQQDFSKSSDVVLHRNKRFVVEALSALSTGVSIYKTVKGILGYNDASFGEIVQGIAGFDPPVAEKVHRQMAALMQAPPQDMAMTKTKEHRMHVMMDALEARMHTNGAVGMMISSWTLMLVSCLPWTQMII